MDRFLFRDINRDNLLAKLLQFIVNVLPILATCVINTIFTGKLDCFTKVNFDLVLHTYLFHSIRGVSKRVFQTGYGGSSFRQFASDTAWVTAFATASFHC